MVIWITVDKIYSNYAWLKIAYQLSDDTDLVKKQNPSGMNPLELVDRAIWNQLVSQI